MPLRKAAVATQEESKKATIAGHQGHWVPMSEQLVTNAAWSGAPSNAWRVYWWLTNRMTGTVKLENDPNIYGVVAGGSTVSFKTIATDLHCHWSSIQRSIEWLVNNGLVARGRGRKGEEYRYQVINSIRQFPLESASSDAEVSKEGIEFLDESKPNTSFLDLCELCGHYDCSGNCDDDGNRPA